MQRRQAVWLVLGVLVGTGVGAGIEHLRLTRRPEAVPEPVVRRVTVPVARPAAAPDAAAEALRRRIAELEQADKLWRDQVAELQAAVASRDADLARGRPGDGERREGAIEEEGRRRAREGREAFEARLRTENPEAFAEMQKRREEMRTRMEQRRTARNEFLSKVDTTRMSEEQRANHEKLLQALATLEAGFAGGEGGGERTPEQREAMRQSFQELGQLYERERQYLLEETGRALGEDGATFAAYVDSIYDHTSMGFGRGRSRGVGEAPPGPPPQGVP